jgi:F-type H+-transporting ATPase subunit gamma
MALKILQQKIVSMTNMEKITSSMKMVAAAKMKGTETRLAAGKLFAQRTTFAAFPQQTYTDDELEEDITIGLNMESEDNSFLVISSDRGLCGGVNTQVSKLARLSMDKLLAEGKQGSINIFGEKSRGTLERFYPEKLGCTMDEGWQEVPSFAIASAVVSRLLVENPDRVHIIFNKYKSAIAYQPTVYNCENYHKFNETALEAGSDVIYPEHLADYEFEPENSTESLQNMFEFSLAGATYYGMIEAQASEESSRMAAMDNASKNAGELIEKYTLLFNRARQAAITTELIEIISGAAALEG